MIYGFVFGILGILLIVFFIFLFLLKLKIETLEEKIQILFTKRVDMIPCIYEISQNNITKHDEIFKEVLALRKLDFTYRNDASLFERTKTQLLIHNELNFIFQILNKHVDFNKNSLFLYTREGIINTSFEIGNSIGTYKKIIAQYNFLIFLKQCTLIGLLIPFTKKENL